MTNSYIQVPPDSTGKRLHTKEYTVDALPVQVQGFHLVGFGDTNHVQSVDAQGQASVRFAEGSPSMSAFGDLRVSTGKIIGVYDFTTDSADDLFSDDFATGGALTYLPNSSTVSLSVTSANGSRASRVSDKYHFYWPGNGNLTLMTVALSDSGMIGCTRRWGYYDARDGVFFCLNASGNLVLTMRSSITGSIVETSIDRVNWNGDKLDGTGLSGMTLDVTKLNIYWCDLQWLGAGRVRMGVVDQFGNRVVAHTFTNANSNAYPYIRTGTLPIGFDIANTALTSGAASIRMTCCSVKTEGELNYTYWRYSYPFPTKTISGTNQPVLTVKSVAQWGGKHNVTTAFPETLGVYVGGTGNIKLDIYWDTMVFTGATFAVDNGSTVIADIAATATTLTTQKVMASYFLGTGVTSIDLSSIFETNDVAINARADETEPLVISFVATKLSGSPTIEGALNYRELR